MRYFLRLSYNGLHFHGWQSQPGGATVQQSLQDALSLICRKEVEVTGAGRTDAGVHARCMYAHFDTPSPVENPMHFLRSVNSLCGKNIVVEEIIPVADEAHARFDAIERTYKYFILYQRSPFLYDFSHFSPRRLDIGLMNEAARHLLSVSDFTSFAKLHSDAKTNLCNVTEAEWQPLDSMFHKENAGICFTISANRFLRNMVRAVVGTLIEVGSGKISIATFDEIVGRKDRCAAGMSMPPQGLFLWNIKYPYI